VKDRFDLEQDILNFSNFSDQLRLVCDSFLEGKLDDDKMTNALEGIAVLIELHQEKTFDSFKQSFNLDNYNGTFV
jgi:hypothetical protein